jgi:hypothetical protein
MICTVLIVGKRLPSNGGSSPELRLEERAEQRGPSILQVAFPLESALSTELGFVASFRFFAAVIGRRSKEAIRASASAKPSRSASGSARLTYPYRSVVSPVEVVRAQNDFERAAAADLQWEPFRTAATGIHSHPDFGLA